MSRNVAILGSTGSIGRQTLAISREMGDRVKITALAAGANAALLEQQAADVHPAVVCLSSGTLDTDRLHGSEVLYGDAGMIEIVTRTDVDLVVVGTSGRAGLLPTMAALQAGKLVALANKETLVMAGALIVAELRSGRGHLVPIDSEHSAIWQCLQGEPSRSIERLTLTASGGALRHLPIEDLVHVTPQQALAHPTWSMGTKITVDSANLMNKGLEVIEAAWLFDLPLDRIDIILHEQSIVHSLVTFEDSSNKAQLGLPDMRLPIQYALSHPHRWPNELPRLDLAQVRDLRFGRVDEARYPALDIARQAGRAGGTYPAVLSAADEVAVEAFLRGRLPFTAIPGVVQAALDLHQPCETPSLDDILESDKWGRLAAERVISRRLENPL